MDLSFLNSLLDNTFIPLYAIVVLLSLWRYPRYYDTPLRFLPILIMYTFLNELFAVLIRDNNEISLILKEIYYNNNWVIFNIYNIVFFVYFYFVYYFYISGKRQRDFIKVGALAFLFISVANMFFQSFATQPQLAAYITGAIVLLYCIFFYWKHLKEQYGDWFLTRDLLSWLSLGMVIFFLGYVPIKIARYYMETEIPWVRSVHLILIILMYGCFAFGFIRMRRRKLQVE